MIKRDKNNNEFYLTESGLWVRNFTNSFARPIEINNLVQENEISILIENELKNSKKMYQKIETEFFSHEKILICSSGYQFSGKIKILEQLPGDVALIGANNVLNEWSINRKLDYYVVNNPFAECLEFFPPTLKVFPRCIASSRTNSEFLQKYYPSLVYIYTPVPDRNYATWDKKENPFLLDDYRNPICAALNLSFRFKAKKIALFTCDEVFEEKRAGSEKVNERLWTYPAQKVAHSLIDGCLYWLSKAGIQIGCFGEGLLYENARYIDEKDLLEFFN